MSHKLMQIEDSEEIEKVTRNTLHPQGEIMFYRVYLIALSANDGLYVAP